MGPTSDGGLTLEWEPIEGRELILDVSSNGDASCLLITKTAEGQEVERDYPIKTPGDLDATLRELKG